MKKDIYPPTVPGGAAPGSQKPEKNSTWGDKFPGSTPSGIAPGSQDQPLPLMK